MFYEEAVVLLEGRYQIMKDKKKSLTYNSLFINLNLQKERYRPALNNNSTFVIRMMQMLSISAFQFNSYQLHVVVQLLNHVQLFAIAWTIAH